MAATSTVIDVSSGSPTSARGSRPSTSGSNNSNNSSISRRPPSSSSSASSNSRHGSSPSSSSNNNTTTTTTTTNEDARIKKLEDEVSSLKRQLRQEQDRSIEFERKAKRTADAVGGVYLRALSTISWLSRLHYHECAQQRRFERAHRIMWENYVREPCIVCQTEHGLHLAHPPDTPSGVEHVICGNCLEGMIKASVDDDTLPGEATKPLKCPLCRTDMAVVFGHNSVSMFQNWRPRQGDAPPLPPTTSAEAEERIRTMMRDQYHTVAAALRALVAKLPNSHNYYFDSEKIRNELYPQEQQPSQAMIGGVDPAAAAAAASSATVPPTSPSYSPTSPLYSPPFASNQPSAPNTGASGRSDTTANSSFYPGAVD